MSYPDHDEPFINDDDMDDIRAKYYTFDLMLKNPQNDGKQVQHEISLAFREIHRLRQALMFYADPDSYFAIAVWGDPPCGAFADDFGPHGFPEYDADDERPGKRARAALRWPLPSEPTP